MKKNLTLKSWNVNGIRAAINKGFWDWFDSENADIVCLQETKITQKDFLKLATNHSLKPLLDEECHELPLNFEPETKRNHKIYYAISCAQKAGYSGVGLLTKIKPNHIEVGVGAEEFDREGRVLWVEFDHFTLVNTYFPNGQRDLKRIPYKLSFSDFLLKKLEKHRKKQPNIIICGDMNVAHAEIDIKNPKTNVNNSGFTQIERDWFTKFLKHGYVDTFRHLHPDAKDVYSWWSYRPGVRARNIGWRIDYFVVTKEMLSSVKKADVQMNQMGSDHCPIELKLRFA